MYQTKIIEGASTEAYFGEITVTPRILKRTFRTSEPQSIRFEVDETISKNTTIDALLYDCRERMPPICETPTPFHNCKASGLFVKAFWKDDFETCRWENDIHKCS